MAAKFDKLLKLLALHGEQAVLAKSACGGAALGVQSLDKLKKAKGKDADAKIQQAAVMSFGEPIENEEIAAIHRRGIGKEAPLTKSNVASDFTPLTALADQLGGGEPAPQFNPANITRDLGSEMAHRARAQAISDAQFLEEIANSGVVATGQLVELSDAMAFSRGLPDEMRQPGLNAVRAQVLAAGPELSPAAKGIDWS